MTGGEEASDAFDRLYEASRHRLVVQVTALAGDRAEAQDLVQEAFTRAWLRWDTVGAYDDPEGWVRRVAYNLGVSRWRRARRLVFRPTAAGALPGPGSAEAPPDTLDGSTGVVAALKGMPLRERRALVLHHLGGLSVDEIATVTGSPTGTVKSQLSRGRHRLAARLAEEKADHG